MHPGGITGAADTGGGKAGGLGASGAAATAAAGGGGGGAGTGGTGRQPNAKVETSGYMRFRDEFDPDYDGDAEQPIANLDFLETDTPELVSAKVRMLQIYNERLDERERRREMIKQMGYDSCPRLLLRMWVVVLTSACGAGTLMCASYKQQRRRRRHTSAA